MNFYTDLNSVCIYNKTINGMNFSVKNTDAAPHDELQGVLPGGSIVLDTHPH
jgi:hypothetical protein